MKVAVVCPDGRSVILFCRGLIVGLIAIPNTKVVVLCDAGDSRQAIEALGARCLQVPVYRFFGVYRDLQYLVRLLGIFRRERFDAVYNISTKPNIFGSIAARLSRVKRVVSHVVGLGSSMLPATSLGRRALQFTYLRLYWLVCRLSDRVWFSNPNDVELFGSRGLITPGKALLTNTYLDVSYYSRDRLAASAVADARRELGIDRGDRVVIMVARMIWAKGIREFVEAAAELVARHPTWRFLLIAPSEPGNLDEVPPSYIEESAARANLLWLQYRNDLRPYYALSDVAVLPSFYREGGQPRALLEAMAMSKPVITTDSIDCRYAVDPGVNGYWVPVRDAPALASAIEQVLGDEDELARFGEASRTRAVELFDERKIVAHALTELGFTAPPVRYGAKPFLVQLPLFPQRMAYTDMEARKQEEIAFHDKLRTGQVEQRWSPEAEKRVEHDPLWSNFKYYAIERNSLDLMQRWLREHCQGAAVLDYCCGNGEESLYVARHGARTVIGIDISDVSIQNCRESAKAAGVSDRVEFKTMDAEALEFADSSFDLIMEYGVLHHLDLDRAMAELARVLKPGGVMVCTETLAHNPFIRWYRRRTPALRTAWEAEHILGWKNFATMAKHFGGIEQRFFHLTALAAVPFRLTPVFRPLLAVLRGIDAVLLNIPGLRWQAWQTVFMLSKPKKSA